MKYNQDDLKEFDAKLTIDSNGNFRPLDDDNTYDLGSSAREWKDLYIDGVAFLDRADVTTLQGPGSNDISLNADLDIVSGKTIDFTDTSTITSAGGLSAVKNPEGYIVIKVNGATKKVAYWS